MTLIDHIDCRVHDLAVARRFYDPLLAALGFSDIHAGDDWASYFQSDTNLLGPFFVLVEDTGHRPGLTRIAFAAATREDVQRAAEVAQAAGALAFEPAHLCSEYSPNYYAAFFEDADGNKLEVCYRGRYTSQPTLD